MQLLGVVQHRHRSRHLCGSSEFTKGKEISGQFSKIGHEKNISLYFLEKGMNMALLESSAVEHIGWNHHILSKNNTQERFYLLKKHLPKEVINVLKMIYKKIVG